MTKEASNTNNALVESHTTQKATSAVNEEAPVRSTTTPEATSIEANTTQERVTEEEMEYQPTSPKRTKSQEAASKKQKKKIEQKLTKIEAGRKDDLILIICKNKSLYMYGILIPKHKI